MIHREKTHSHKIVPTFGINCCFMCNTASLYVIDSIATVKLGLGHISSALGRGGGGPIVTDDIIICPLRG
jgi:hypothetical protein